MQVYAFHDSNNNVMFIGADHHQCQAGCTRHTSHHPVGGLFDIKITAQMQSTAEVSKVDSAVNVIIQSYPNATLDHTGTMMGSLLRDWIVVFDGVNSDEKLLKQLKRVLVAVLQRDVLVESFLPGDAYPGAAALYGYPPGHLVLNAR